MNHANDKSERPGLAGYCALLLLIGAAACLWRGWTAQALSVRRFVFWQETYSMWESLMHLRESGEMPLFMLVFTLSFIFPALKVLLLMLCCVLSIAWTDVLVRMVGVLSRWSLLDVLAIAVIVIASRMSGLASAHVHEGIWFFCGAVALTTLATGILEHIQQRQLITNVE